MSIDSELRRRRKKKAYAQWRGRCFWCHERLTTEAATVDHLLPLSLGGTNERPNCVLCCFRCNQGRGNRLSPPVGVCLRGLAGRSPQHKKVVEWMLTVWNQQQE